MFGKIKDKIINGIRLNEREGRWLFESDDIFALAELASKAAKRKIGKKAYYVRNIHINPTNICVNRCKFCAFSRSMGDADAYELSIDEILDKIRDAMPVEEVHMVGGLHPYWQFEHYLDIIKAIKAAFRYVHVKAFTAAEADYMRTISGLPLKRVFEMLRQSGLNAMPGGGAEIFSPSIRRKLCPEKLDGRRWLHVMRAAHDAGIKTNATMLYGHMENYGHRIRHLIKLREIQDETGGFQAFIPLPYQPKDGMEQSACSSGIDDLKTIAVSRLMLDNFKHIKAYWVMLGEKISQMALLFGADDLDGTVIEERISYSAGAKSRRGITEAELINLIEKAGRIPVRRDALYRRAGG